MKGRRRKRRKRKRRRIKGRRKGRRGKERRIQLLFFCESKRKRKLSDRLLDQRYRKFLARCILDLKRPTAFQFVNPFKMFQIKTYLFL